MSYQEDLKQAILSNNVLDPEDLHHEFVSGMHGRKLDFDLMPTGGSFYKQWMDANVQYIRENYATQPDMILGVADGANRMAISIALGLGNGIIGLTTDKISPKSVALSKVAKDFISTHKPEFVLIVEDVGTAGTTSASAAAEALAAGAKKVSVLNTWQRREHLEKLEEAGVEYDSIIKDFLPTYQPEDCVYCKQGVKFIPHAK
jgi:orotate phosphoribosyltransferase